MQIPKSTYRIPTLLLTALSEGSASKNNDSTFSLRSSASTPMISTSTATATLQASLAATALDKADPPLSRVPTIAGVPSPALSYALSHGGVNPLDWLTESDVKLFEQTTGGTIKDGRAYNKDGKGDPATDDFAFSLYCMRNFGTYSASDGQPQLIKGDITADDIKNFIGYYQSRHSTAFNFDVLEKALDVLAAKEA